MRPPRRALRLSWSDRRFRGLVWQVLAVGFVLIGVVWLVANTQANLANRHIASGFGFLANEAGLPIGERLISYSPTDTYFRALLVGVLNTLKVAVTGIALAPLLGTAIGIARLSTNWLLSRVAGAYVEVVRDVPLLLHLLLIYALLQFLPAPRQALNPVEGVYLSIRGLHVPALDWQAAHWLVLGALTLGAAAAIIWARRTVASGWQGRIWPAVLALVIGPPIVTAILSGANWIFVQPELKGFNFRGGMTLSPEFVALLAGLVIYTSGFIAEIVRSGIQAVQRGQWEAAEALGLPRGLIMRLIVLPQALRVIIPPVTSQYLNLTKNSSLAVAIGYQDIVSITNTTINQTGQAVEGIAIIMAVYLAISLTISLVMNSYNAHVALVER